MIIFWYEKTIIANISVQSTQCQVNLEKKTKFLHNIFSWSIPYTIVKKNFKSYHILFFFIFMTLLFLSAWGLSTTWTHICLLRPCCYSLAALLVKKTYSLVSISLSIKNNVFGLTSKLFYCLTKCLISAEALHNSYYTAAPVTLLILTVSNYAQFILFDFLVVNCYVFSKPPFWKLTHSRETLVTRWLY